MCYRKYGHNEGDGQGLPVSLLYESISKHKNPREIYKEKLMNEGVFEAGIAKELEQDFQNLLQDRFDEISKGNRKKQKLLLF